MFRRPAPCARPRADGYLATLVAGMPIFEHKEATGAPPGKLLRGKAAG
ncbi:hypothetical protein ACTMU2_27115 [Cupriavidus basilensis]